MDNLTIKIRDLLISEIEGDISIEDVDVVLIKQEYARLAKMILELVGDEHQKDIDLLNKRISDLEEELGI